MQEGLLLDFLILSTCVDRLNKSLLNVWNFKFRLFDFLECVLRI